MGTAARRFAVIAATLLMALCAHISFPQPFNPVPTTMQTFGVLLLGMALGPLSSAAAMVLYLLEGASGWPVFSPQGLPGVAHLLGPSGGFLFAYPVAAAVAGLVLRALQKRISTFLAAIAAGVCGLVPIFALGTGWLAIALHLAPHRAIQLAVIPFLPGEGVKLVLVAALVATLLRQRQRA